MFLFSGLILSGNLSCIICKVIYNLNFIIFLSLLSNLGDITRSTYGPNLILIRL